MIITFPFIVKVYIIFSLDIAALVDILILLMILFLYVYERKEMLKNQAFVLCNLKDI